MSAQHQTTAYCSFNSIFVPIFLHIACHFPFLPVVCVWCGVVGGGVWGLSLGGWGAMGMCAMCMTVPPAPGHNTKWDESYSFTQHYLHYVRGLAFTLWPCMPMGGGGAHVLLLPWMP